MKIVLPTRRTIWLAVSPRRIHCKISVATAASLVPLREFDVNFIFSVNPNMVGRSVGKQPEHDGFVHPENIALNHPLICAKTQVVGSKHLRRSPLSSAIDNSQMQVSAAIDADIGGVALGHAGHPSRGDNPLMSFPGDRLRLQTSGAIQDDGEDHSSKR